VRIGTACPFMCCTYLQEVYTIKKQQIMEGQIRSCRCEEENKPVQKVGGALIQHEEEMK